jgi:hypothetical protein
MKVLDRKGFKLPYVDSQTYRELMRLGLQYDRQLRTYCAEELDAAGAEVVLALLSKILHEEVCFEEKRASAQPNLLSLTCIICGKRFQCTECRYFELCETKNTPSSCICGKCLEEGKAISEE